MTDPALTQASLARPGEVIKVSRGGREAQLAALPADPPRAAKPRPTAQPSAEAKPSRAALDEAEAALAGAEARHEAERAALEEEVKALERRRRALKTAQGAETRRLARARDQAEEAYRSALERWRG